MLETFCLAREDVLLSSSNWCGADLGDLIG
jgi:hypothetical protein